MCRASPSPQARVACRATRSTFAATRRETTSTATASAIPAGTPATPSASTASKSTRVRRPLLFGRGSTGGVINIVSKLPQDRDFYVVEGTGNIGGRRPRYGRFQQDVRRCRDAHCGGGLRHRCRRAATSRISSVTASRRRFPWQLNEQRQEHDQLHLPERRQHRRSRHSDAARLLFRHQLTGSRRRFRAIPITAWQRPARTMSSKTDAHNLINKFEHDFVARPEIHQHRPATPTWSASIARGRCRSTRH